MKSLLTTLVLVCVTFLCLWSSEASTNVNKSLVLEMHEGANHYDLTIEDATPKKMIKKVMREWKRLEEETGGNAWKTVAIWDVESVSAEFGSNLINLFESNWIYENYSEYLPDYVLELGVQYSENNGCYYVLYLYKMVDEATNTLLESQNDL